jgi:hypothetical protein
MDMLRPAYTGTMAEAVGGPSAGRQALAVSPRADAEDDA